VLNAANEEGVRAFLNGEVGFTRIVGLVEEALGAVPEAGSDLDAILEADRRAREYVRSRVGKVSA
jgi:1-deoxy-D-xylulose-5-phosphate reductoisomerase